MQMAEAESASFVLYVLAVGACSSMVRGRGVSGFRHNPLVAITLCAGIAGFLCLLLSDVSARWIAPLLFLLATIPIAHLWGTKAGIIGAAVANLIFAVFLFPPIGRLAVRGATDRIILISFQLCAIGVAYLSRVEPACEFFSSAERPDRNIWCFRTGVAGSPSHPGEVSPADCGLTYPARLDADQSAQAEKSRHRSPALLESPE
jgi:Domain of unknown function (DUF4118)